MKQTTLISTHPANLNMYTSKTHAKDLLSGLSACLSACLSVYPQATGHVTFIQSQTLAYTACPRDYNGRPCHKKLQDQGDGTWWVHIMQGAQTV